MHQGTYNNYPSNNNERGTYKDYLYNNSNEVQMSSQMPMRDNQKKESVEHRNKGKIKNGKLNFVGNAQQFLTVIDSLNDKQKQTIKEVTLRVAGQQLKQMDWRCCLLTLCLGCILIVPFFLICFSTKWRNKVSSAHQLSISTYERIRILTQMPNLKQIILFIVDSKIDENKANILYSSLSRSCIQKFTFINGAGAINYQGTYYSDFKRNFQNFKNLGIDIYIKWYDQTVFSDLRT